MKYVLVTGAYGGMGKATIKKLKELGYFVFALDKKVEEAEENICPIEADITSEESVKNAFGKIKEKTNELFAIIHYAGIYKLDSLVEIENADFERIFKINVNGTYLINKTFLPLLKQGSRIVMTTSELAPLNPLPFTGIYAITKSALDKYAHSLKMELQLLGIHVSVLRAGAEPLLNNQIIEIIKKLKSFNKKVVLCTNDIISNDNLWDKLLVLDIDAISFSLDSYKKEYNDYVRVKNSWQMVTNNILNIKSKIKQKNLKTKIGVYSVITKMNLQDLYETYKFCSNDLCVDYYIYQPITLPPQHPLHKN